MANNQTFLLATETLYETSSSSSNSSSSSDEEIKILTRKKFYSVVLQAVCDSQYKFMNIYCGWAGATHDSRDSDYANNDWLLVPYKDNGHLTQVQNHYNYIDSATRIKIEQAFGLLNWIGECCKIQ
ncbi:11842_t:CDS:2 [Diversispora eburnea]|uniref:11842_t:CDS:1 n=1 Tax=Diversispora eburnea TaxID=1213867 RepID=A0A9N9D1A8_9GLOM|nr:11842_t:CDS:2 [Diversispora eburnea]